MLTWNLILSEVSLILSGTFILKRTNRERRFSQLFLHYDRFQVGQLLSFTGFMYSMRWIT